MKRSAAAARVDFGRVIANLSAQVEGYRQLTALTQREFVGLLGGRSEDLTVLLAAQEAAVVALQQLEHERLAGLEPLARAWARPAADLTLHELSTAAAPEVAARLERLRGALSDQLLALRELNARNRRLLTSATAILTRWRAFMLSSLQPGATYSARGARTAPALPGALDQAA